MERERATQRYKRLQITITQERAVELLISGKNDSEVAKAIGVHRVTVLNWRLHHPGVQAALNARREAAWQGSQDRLRALLWQAMDAIEEELKSPGPVRSKLAVELLRLSRFGSEPLSAIGPVDPEVIVENAYRASQQRDLVRSLLTEDKRDATANELLRRADGPPVPTLFPDVATDPLEPSPLTDD